MRQEHPLPGSDLVVDGVRMYVVRHGRDRRRGVAPPLLLLHGAFASSYLWRDVMRDLEDDRRTLAPDLVGLGRSERPLVGGLDAAAQARRLVVLLDLLGAQRVAVAGHGIGGAVAVHLTALVPDRVAWLALLAAPVHADAWPLPGTLPLLVPGLAVGYLGTARSRRHALRVALGAPQRLPAAILDHYAAPLGTRDGVRGIIRFVRAVDLAAAEVGWELVRRSPPSTLILWGRDDAVLSSAYGERLVAELPTASWVPVAGAGHLLPEELPERVAEELAGFGAEVEAG